MTRENFDEYVANRHDPAVALFETRAECSKKWCWRFQKAILTFSAVTPFLVGLGTLNLGPPSGLEVGIEIASLVSASIAPSLAAWMRFAHYRENFIKNRRIEHRLKKELILCKAGIEAYENHPDRFKLFAERVEATIDEGLRLRAPSSDELKQLGDPRY